MPTYEYACPACGNRYEKRESFEAPVRQKCPKCRKMAVRVLSAPAVVFKGSGFYKTDNRGTDKADQPAAATTTAAAPGSGDGHSHGGDGHTHGTDSTATEAPKSDAAPKNDAAKAKPKTETPAAP